VNRVLILTACWLLSMTCARAQGGFLFHHLTLEEGLSELTNEYVYKDSKGFVWISSINGLNRFDGSRIRVYKPIAGDSTSIDGEIIQSNFYEDSSSLLWFCTYEAINAYDPVHDRFRSYFLGDSSERVEGYHIFHLDDQSNLWLMVEARKLYKFHIPSKSFRHITTFEEPYLKAIACGHQGNVEKIFLYTAFTPGISILNLDDQDDVIRLDRLDGLVTVPPIIPKAMINEGDSLLWIAGEDELVRYQISSGKATSTPIEKILTLENYNDTLLLISVDEEGIWEYHKNKNVPVHQYQPVDREPHSLLGSRIKYISGDRDQGFWFTSVGRGISFAYPAKRKFKLLHPVSREETVNLKFIPIGFKELGNGDVFCATNLGGLYTLSRHGSIISHWKPKDESLDERMRNIYSIFQDRNKNIWLNSFRGLSVIPAHTKDIVPVTNQDRVLLTAVELADGRLIFSANEGGLYEVKSRESEYDVLPFQESKYIKPYIPAWQDKKGTIWLNENLQKFILVSAADYNTIGELPISGIISGFVETDSTVWVASSSGLYEVDAERLLIRKAYNEKNGLSCPAITNMLIDSRKRLWLSCRNEIIVFDTGDKSIHAFSQNDGLPPSQVSLYGAYQFQNGEMWFSSADGITSFYPDKIEMIKIDAIPQITGILVNDQIPSEPLVCLRSDATHITEIRQLQFPYRHNTLSFVVNALEYSAPGTNKVSYMLAGFDDRWVNAFSGSTVRYPNLPPGKYTFRIKAANSDGVFNPELRELYITITPPFYYTWWFILLSVLAAIALVAYIVYLNFSRKLELQNVRLRLYENLHDDVGSRLTAIVLTAEDMIRDEKVVHPRLQHINTIAKSIVGNMRRLVWAIDPENDSMNSLVQKIRHDRTLILDEKVAFHIEIQESLQQRQLPGEVRYQLTSIINEALNNVSKYAQAENVWIRFDRKEKHMSMTIRDDGVGFEPGEKSNDKVRSSGYGVENMKKRVRRIKGDIRITSAPGAGTAIEVLVPLP
jgi:ligand-binding sensor domain-containing protein